MKYTDGGHDYEMRFLGYDKYAKQLRFGASDFLHQQYDPILKKVAYLDYKHKLKLDREKQAAKAKALAEKQAAQKKAERSKRFSSVRHSAGKAVGKGFSILPLIIIVSIISVIGANFVPLTETFTVGDKTFTRYRASGEDANEIGSIAWGFGEDVLLALSDVGGSVQNLFISDAGTFNSTLLDMVSGFMLSVGDTISKIVDFVENAIEPYPGQDDRNGDGKINWWDSFLKVFERSFGGW